MQWAIEIHLYMLRIQHEDLRKWTFILVFCRKRMYWMTPMKCQMSLVLVHNCPRRPSTRCYVVTRIRYRTSWPARVYVSLSHVTPWKPLSKEKQWAPQLAIGIVYPMKPMLLIISMIFQARVRIVCPIKSTGLKGGRTKNYSLNRLADYITSDE